MAHRFSCFRPACLNQVFRGLVSVSVVVAAAQPLSSDAAELLRSPGWLAVMPDDSQPVVPEVRAKGREWFVDAAKGDDMGAGSKSSPWKTLGRLKRAALSSGDVVRLRCGSVWRETLLLDGRSLPAGLTIAAEEGCATGKSPSIRGSDVVEAAWAADAATKGGFVTDRFGAASALFYKGQRMLPARMPDAGGPGQEFLLADGQNSRRSFRLREAERGQIGSRELVGATVYVRAVPWQVEKAVVSSYDPASGVVTLDKELTSNILTGAGYILEGKRWMMNTKGEWFHDTSTKRLSFLSPDGQVPNLGDIEVVSRDHAILVRGAKQLRVLGLDLRQTAGVALDVQSTRESVFEGLDFAYPGEYAVVIDQSSGVTLKGSRVVASGWSSIMTRNAPDCVVDGNLVIDSGLLGRAVGSGAAIIANGERNLVTRNVVLRAANAGITFFNKEGTSVVDNVVIQPCARLADCGGIYTWTGHSPSLATRKRTTRATVKNNVVLGGTSNLEGTAGRGRNQSVGIYLDEMTGGVQVLSNVLAGMENGVYLHNAQFNDITDNTVRAVTHASITAHMSLPDQDVIRGNRLRNNSLVSRPPARGGDEVFAFKWQQRADAARLFSGDDANVVQDNEVVRAGGEGRSRWLVGEGVTTRTLAPGDWQKFAVREREQVLNLAPEPVRQLERAGAGVVLDGDMRAKPSAWSPYFNPAGAGGVATPMACDGVPCIRFVTGHMGDVLSSKSFKMSAQNGKNNHVLRYTVKAGPKGGAIRVTVRRNGPPYEGFGLDQPPLKLSPGQVFKAELPFEATSADPARVDFSAEPGSEVFLSQVEVAQVAPASTQRITAARSLFLVNLSDRPRNISCSETGLPDCAAVDDAGREVKWPLALAPRKGVAVFPRQAGN